MRALMRCLSGLAIGKMVDRLPDATPATRETILLLRGLLGRDQSTILP